MADRPDLKKFKDKLKEEPVEEVAPKQVREAAPPPKLRRETMEQLGRFVEDVAAAPVVEEESLKKEKEKEEKKGPVYFYRNNAYDSAAVRKSVESRCSPLALGDLLLTGKVRQQVPIIPGSLDVTFKSLVRAESQWLESTAFIRHTSEYEARTFLNQGRLALSILSINEQKYPDCLKDGKIDAAIFDAKYERVLALGELILDILITNHGWFEDRVAHLVDFSFEDLKNG